MFNKRKERPKRDHSGKNLSQYGLFNIPTDFNTGLGNDSFEDDAGDSDLEAELEALSSDNAPTRPQRKKPTKNIIPQGELDAMVAHSVKGVDDDDDDISVDENDPELLGELNEIAGEEEEVEVTTSAPAPPPEPSVISDTGTVLLERLKNYEQAEKNAKASGETSKARRYGRAIKTLKDLVKQAQAGKPVDLNDESVPPEIHVGDKKPSRPAPPLPVNEPQEEAPTISNEERSEPEPELVTLPANVQERVSKEKASIDTELLGVLSERQKLYKIAALKAKKEGDADTAIRYVKIAKQFEHVIAAVQSGQEVDLSNMPGPPGEAPVEEAKPEQSETQKNAASEIEVPEEAQNLPEQELISASTVGEALEQRLAVYKQHETQAKEEGNSSKARRFGRIVKQYEQAIKQYKAGKPIAVEELPTPPGYGPIPVEGAPPAPMPKAKPETPTSPSTSSSGAPTTSGGGATVGTGQRKSGNHVNTSHAEKQVLILLAKQKQFKQAALNAKKKGEMMEAKELLRQAKGFDKLIEAAQAGLPVDWSSIPVSPEAKSQLDNEYDIVMAQEATEESTADLDVLARLENQLQKQLKMCLSTRDHNRALGDVAGTNRFERLALNVTKDLDLIRMAKKVGGAIPKFRYETKEFSIVKSFTDIPDNSMEVTIHRGINYQTENPKEIDTYVTIEFPFPQDTPFTGRTATIKDTNNPSYNKTFVIPIQRNSRQCQRVFKRHGLKFEVFAKGGLFRGDSHIGTVNVKLQPLETQCEIHDSFDLLEGRKKIGGKLEIQIKLRNPIVTQQVEQIQEKWLVIDQ